jgi:hypothetical protein
MFDAAPAERAQYRHILGVSKLRAGDRWGAVGSFFGIVRDGPGLGLRLRAFGHGCITAVGGASLWRALSKDAAEAAG